MDLPAANPFLGRGPGGIGGNPIGWKGLFWNQAKTLPRIILWRDYAGPVPEGAVVLAPKKFLEASRVVGIYPQSFGYFLTKSNSWRAGTARPKNKKTRECYLINWIPVCVGMMGADVRDKAGSSPV